jgi:hypothetical protein
MTTNDWSQTVAKLLIGLGYSPADVSQALRVLSGEVDFSQRPLLTTGQLCRLLRCSRTTIWRMRLPSVVVGKRKRYSIDAVMAFLKGTEVTGVTNPASSTKMANGLPPSNDSQPNTKRGDSGRP